MGGEHQVKAPADVVIQLGDDAVGVGAARHDGVAVVAHHVGVHAVQLRDLQVIGLGIGLYHKADAGDLHLALLHHVVHRAQARVKHLAKGLLEVGHQPGSAAVGVIGHGGGGAIGGHPGQEGRARGVIGHQLALHRDVLPSQKVGELLNVVIEAGQLDHHAPARLGQDEHLVLYGVPGLIGVQGDAVLLINVNPALVQGNGAVCVLVHDNCLQRNFKFERLLFSFVGSIITP